MPGHSSRLRATKDSDRLAGLVCLLEKNSNDTQDVPSGGCEEAASITSFTGILPPEPCVSQAPAVTMCGKITTIRSVLKIWHMCGPLGDISQAEGSKGPQTVANIWLAYKIQEWCVPKLEGVPTVKTRATLCIIISFVLLVATLKMSILGHDMNLEGPLCRGGDPSVLIGPESLCVWG